MRQMRHRNDISYRTKISYSDNLENLHSFGLSSKYSDYRGLWYDYFMKQNFYDKVAKKFGSYGYGISPQYESEYPVGDPEKIFKQKLLELSSKDKTALDIGCADGKFTLSVASYFKKIYGIDTSRENLVVAQNHNKKNKNIEYSYQDARHTSFKNSFFDLIYCRRGPTFYREYCRIIKTNGYYLEIGIGEKDAIDLKKIFGRGQEYGKWNKSKLVLNMKELKDLGFETVFAKDFYYFEYYPSYHELDLFLQGVPIFEDFDSKEDNKALRKYVEKFTFDKGIKLSRHRLVMAVRKV